MFPLAPSCAIVFIPTVVSVSSFYFYYILQFVIYSTSAAVWFKCKKQKNKACPICPFMTHLVTFVRIWPYLAYIGRFACFWSICLFFRIDNRVIRVEERTIHLDECVVRVEKRTIHADECAIRVEEWRVSHCEKNRDYYLLSRLRSFSAPASLGSVFCGF